MTKKLYSLLLLAAFALGINAYAVEKLIQFDQSTTPGQRQASVAILGGKVKADLPEIYTVLAVFDKEANVNINNLDSLKRSNRNIVNTGDNTYRKWINQNAPLKRINSSGAGSELRQINSSARSNIPKPKASLGEDSLEAEKKEQEQKALKEQVMPWGIEHLNARLAWDRGLTGKGAVVAVIDTGVDLNHKDLKANIIGGYNATDQTKSPQDGQGHGTHVAGTVAAVNNKVGVIGVAPEAKILAVKVLDDHGGGTPFNIALGIIWAANNGANVINMSLGSSEPFMAVEAAVKYAVSKNVTVIAASGNDGADSHVDYPGAYKQVIAVGASNFNGKRAEFSNAGKAVEFIAPGEDVLSSIPGGTYEFNSGTSMASPHVAGLAALAVQAGAKTPDEVKAMLKAAAKPLKGLTKAQQGNGFIDASLIGR